jgi:hypothetical protein
MIFLVAGPAFFAGFLVGIWFASWLIDNSEG